MNDAQIADFVSLLYRDDVPAGTWAHILPHDGGYVAHARPDDHHDVIVWRGSTTLADWMQDLNALPVEDGQLGMVHGGFCAGVRAVAAQVKHWIARPVIICGHSLGAGHALIHAGLLKLADEDILEVCTFGSPRPGGIKLADILTGVPIRSYKNRADPVTDVPVRLGYMHPRALIPVDVAPQFSDSWGLLADHHMALYRTAMQGLFPPPA